MTRATLVLVVLSVCVTLAQSGNDAEMLKALVKQIATAQTAYDAPTLGTLLTADYVEVSPVGDVDPREKVLGFYKPELKPPADKTSVATDVSEYSIRQYGQFAVVIVRLTSTITMEGKALPPRSLRATFLCRKEQGAWRVASAQYTGIRPSQGQPTGAR